MIVFGLTRAADLIVEKTRVISITPIMSEISPHRRSRYA
jgi:hypothetical protein